MSMWMERLRKLKAPADHPTKPMKPGSVGSVGCLPGTLQKFDGDSASANDPPAIERQPDQVPDPDRWCWPNGEGMNTLEIAQYSARLARFADRGMTEDEAERVADLLMRRDRNGDYRRMCIECSHLGASGRCLAAAVGRLPGVDRRLEPVPIFLQRCEAFGLRKGLA
jgi:hypothetical protein